MECKLLWGQDGGARIRIDDKTLSPVAYMTYAPEASVSPPFGRTV